MSPTIDRPIEPSRSDAVHITKVFVEQQQDVVSSLRDVLRPAAVRQASQMIMSEHGRSWQSSHRTGVSIQRQKQQQKQPRLNLYASLMAKQVHSSSSVLRAIHQENAEDDVDDSSMATPRQSNTSRKVLVDAGSTFVGR